MPLAEDDAEVLGVPGEEHLQELWLVSRRGRGSAGKTYAHAAHVVHAGHVTVARVVHGGVVHVSMVVHVCDGDERELVYLAVRRRE